MGGRCEDSDGAKSSRPGSKAITASVSDVTGASTVLFGRHRATQPVALVAQDNGGSVARLQQRYG